jgi:hypothetical protein
VVEQVPRRPEQVRVPQGRDEYCGRAGHPPLLRLSHRPGAQAVS